MNKKQVIYIIFALGVFLIVSFFILVGKAQQMARVGNIRGLAYDLIQTTNSQRLTSIPSDLQKSLEEFLASPAKLEPVHPGQVGDPVRVRFNNAKGEHLAILLQWDQNLRKFKPLRHWYPEAPPDSGR